jgi:hypothetical protein
MKYRFHVPLIVAMLLITNVAGASATPVINISLPTVQYGTGSIGQTVDVPITVSDLTGLGITNGFNFQLLFNATVLEYVGYDAVGTLSDSMSQAGC